MIVRSYEIFIIYVFLYGMDMFTNRRRNPQQRGVYVVTRSLIEDLLIFSRNTFIERNDHRFIYISYIL
jgi:hypothetical protein